MRPANLRFLLLVPALVLFAACAGNEYRFVGSEPLKNEDGHIVGHKERLRDIKTGEEFEQVIEYTARRNEKGDIIGYEEPVREGILLRDINGRRVGVRYTDLRSRGSNPGNEGIQVQIKPQQP